VAYRFVPQARRKLSRSNSLLFGALPLLFIVSADALVIGLSNDQAIPPAPENQRTSLYLGAVAVVAALVIVPRVVVRSLAAVLLLAAVMVGAASVGFLYIPALIAAIYAANYESRLRKSPPEIGPDA
jgi:hypothetical protein